MKKIDDYEKNRKSMIMKKIELKQKKKSKTQ